MSRPISSFAGADRPGDTIILGTRCAMMLNSRDDINRIIHIIGKQHEIEAIRIYNKEGKNLYVTIRCSASEYSPGSFIMKKIARNESIKTGILHLWLSFKI